MISRLEAEEPNLEFEIVDLCKPIADSYRHLLPQAEASGITVELRVSEGPIVVEGDNEALRELADNLLSNAIKYTPRDGRVEVRLEVDGANAVLEVEDTGIGIAPEDQNRVFERFYRVDRARSRQMGGTGLGLSIVKHVALAHGGSVSVKSQQGRGSIFRVLVPLKSGVVKALEVDSVEKPPGGSERGRITES
jgi:signal transduction histidine kinase